MVYEVNQSAVDDYKRMQGRTSDYALEKDYLPGSNLSTPVKRVSVTTPQKKVKGDRSLRIDDWVGGFSPEGQASKRRSWKIKDKASIPRI
eukprot:scaffold10725_cov147-Cylindrotheca_fusiformis.AAC.4